MKAYMNKKIIYIVKSDLAYYPPCMSQICMLDDLGVDIEVWFGSSKYTAVDILGNRGIPYVELVDPRGKLPGKLDKLNNWASFRKAVKNRLKTVDRPDTILWFGTAETAMPMVGALTGWTYVASALELNDDNETKKKLMGRICREATAVTACEETRSYIMRSWWGLERLPYVFPNKPYGMELRRELPLTCDETRRIAEDMKGKKFVIYQGILHEETYVAEIAKALKELGGEYPLVLMGIDNSDMAPRIKAVYENTYYYPSIPAPKHLEVTSRAYIGVVFYKADILNEAFCAPNKIYEYSSFGLPMLANDIPGLTNTVGNAGCAECVPLEKDSIIEAIKRIDADYSRYSNAADKFFASTDNTIELKRLLRDIGVL